MNEVLVNKSRIYHQFSEQSELDEVIQLEMAPDELKRATAFDVKGEFVLCRDKSGKPTAVYKNSSWDFTPYSLSNKIWKISFEGIVGDDNRVDDIELVEELKRALFCLIYFVHAGAVGSLSVTTFHRYAQTLKQAAFFCQSCRDNKMIGQLSLSELFSNEMYLSFYINSLMEHAKKRQNLNSVLNHLNNVGVDRLGYSIAQVPMFEPIDHNQTPLIPTRIYLETINILTGRLDFLKAHTKNLEFFIAEFKNPYVGFATKKSREQQRRDGIKCPITYPTFNKLLQKYGLEKLFNSENYQARNRRTLVSSLRAIQLDLKYLIHLYTGIRDGEYARLPYECIGKDVIKNEVKGVNGETLAPAQMIDILSTTTKFSGYRREASWIAHSTVLSAVQVLQIIVRGFAAVASLTPHECPLFVRLTGISQRELLKHPPRVPDCTSKRPETFRGEPELRITQADYDVLRASDEDRDFSEKKFQVGQPWPFTTHQFRRSLAFYACNSGFVSIPTLRKQFKHLCSKMTKYYSRNFEKIKTIFGHYDTENKQYVLPINHIAFELQVGMPIAMVEELLKDLLDNRTPLYGKTGGYIEKRRKELSYGEVLIEDFREETIEKVEKGEMSYRKTLLGGCTNLEVCECSILGEFADCLTSNCAVIKPDNVDSLIDSTTKELAKYSNDSVEYLATKAELDELIKFRSYRMNSREV